MTKPNTKPKLKIVYKNLIDLKDATYNPRKITEKQLEEIRLSMKKFGTVEPLIINTYKGRENVIVGGHRRKQVLLLEGTKQAPCVEVCLDKKEERELNIRLNKNTGSFDDELLEDYFDKSELQQWGFDDFELNGMFVEEDSTTSNNNEGGNGEGSNNNESDSNCKLITLKLTPEDYDFVVDKLLETNDNQAVALMEILQNY